MYIYQDIFFESSCFFFVYTFFHYIIYKLNILFCEREPFFLMWFKSDFHLLNQNDPNSYLTSCIQIKNISKISLINCGKNNFSCIKFHTQQMPSVCKRAYFSWKPPLLWQSMRMCLPLMENHIKIEWKYTMQAFIKSDHTMALLLRNLSIHESHFMIYIRIEIYHFDYLIEICRRHKEHTIQKKN